MFVLFPALDILRVEQTKTTVSDSIHVGGYFLQFIVHRSSFIVHRSSFIVAFIVHRSPLRSSTSMAKTNAHFLLLVALQVCRIAVNTDANFQYDCGVHHSHQRKKLKTTSKKKSFLNLLDLTGLASQLPKQPHRYVPVETLGIGRYSDEVLILFQPSCWCSATQRRLH